MHTHRCTRVGFDLSPCSGTDASLKEEQAASEASDIWKRRGCLPLMSCPSRPVARYSIASHDSFELCELTDGVLCRKLEQRKHV